MGVKIAKYPWGQMRKHDPLDETRLAAVRGLIHQEVSTKVRQRGVSVAVKAVNILSTTSLA